jgi:hypothetical protein
MKRAVNFMEQYIFDGVSNAKMQKTFFVRSHCGAAHQDHLLGVQI